MRAAGKRSLDRPPPGDQLKKKRSSEGEDFGFVKAALESAPLPESCRRMLAAAVEVSLGVPRQGRDEFQTTVVSFIAQTLHEMETCFVDGENAQNDAILRARTREADSMHAKNAATEKLAKAESALRETEQLLSQSTQQMQQATSESVGAQEACISCEAESALRETEQLLSQSTQQ